MCIRDSAWAPGVLEPKIALAWLQSIGPGYSALVYLSAYLVLSTCLVPAIALHIVAGVAFGLPEGLLLALAGANVASNVHFILGRAIGRERLGAWLRRRGHDRALEGTSLAAIAASRVIPLPFLAVNLSWGASGVPWRSFLLGSGLGMIAPVAAHTVLASQLYEGVEGARLQAFAWAAGAGVLLAALAGVPRVLRNRQRPRP